MLRALTTIALLALPGTAMAGDLTSKSPIDLRTDFADPGWSFYVQGYGGVVVQDTVTVTQTFHQGPDTFSESFANTLGAGPVFGASFGIATPVDGLSIGLDVMHTHQDFTNFDPSSPATLDSTSIMGTVEGTYHLSPRFDVYATGGLGGIVFHYTDPLVAADGLAPAYQVAVGLRANVTENVSLFTEIKHQDVFNSASLGGIFGNDDNRVAKANNALLAGLRYSFN